MKKTGAELIAIERQEQIEKHGRTVERDLNENKFSQLIDGAIGLLCEPRPNDKPSHWDSTLWTKMKNKPYKERLIIAGALIAAELDCIQTKEE